MKLGEAELFYCFPVFYKTLRKSPAHPWALELIFFPSMAVCITRVGGCGEGRLGW